MWTTVGVKRIVDASLFLFFFFFLSISFCHAKKALGLRRMIRGARHSKIIPMIKVRISQHVISVVWLYVMHDTHFSLNHLKILIFQSLSKLSWKPFVGWV